MYSAAQIKRFLLDDVNEMASLPELISRSPGKDFTKPKKLSLKDVLLLPIFMKQDSTGSELLTYFGNDPDAAPSFSAYRQQRDKLLPDAFLQLLQRFNSHFLPTLFNDELVLTAVDGTKMNLYYDPKSPLTFIKPNDASPKGHNELHVTAALRVSDGMYSDVVIQPGNHLDERADFCEMVDRDSLSAGIPLYLADRGFPSLNVFAHCINKGAFFLIRATELYVQRLLRDDMPESSRTEFDVEVDRIVVRHTQKNNTSTPNARKSTALLTKILLLTSSSTYLRRNMRYICALFA
ncbi:MAG: transposase [Eubacteriales bacterium]|nr:transposase [Eubacteriales bacterium]